MISVLVTLGAVLIVLFILFLIFYNHGKLLLSFDEFDAASIWKKKRRGWKLAERLLLEKGSPLILNDLLNFATDDKGRRRTVVFLDRFMKIDLNKFSRYDSGFIDRSHRVYKLLDLYNSSGGCHEIKLQIEELLESYLQDHDYQGIADDFAKIEAFPVSYFKILNKMPGKTSQKFNMQFVSKRNERYAQEREKETKSMDELISERPERVMYVDFNWYMEIRDSISLEDRNEIMSEIVESFSLKALRAEYHPNLLKMIYIDRCIQDFMRGLRKLVSKNDVIESETSASLKVVTKLFKLIYVLEPVKSVVSFLSEVDFDCQHCLPNNFRHRVRLELEKEGLIVEMEKEFNFEIQSMKTIVA